LCNKNLEEKEAKKNEETPHRKRNHKKKNPTTPQPPTRPKKTLREKGHAVLLKSQDSAVMKFGREYAQESYYQNSEKNGGTKGKKAEY